MKTKNQLAILDFLKDREYVSPTEIGNVVGGYIKCADFLSPLKMLRHSSWASPICLRMVKLKMLKRNKKGWYKRI